MLRDRERMVAHRAFLQRENEKKRRREEIEKELDKIATSNVLMDYTLTAFYSHITLDAEELKKLCK